MVRTAPVKTTAPRTVRTEIVIAAVGDIMMPLSIQHAAARNKSGYDRLFEKIRRDFAGVDIVFANLETPVVDGSPVSGYPKFNAHSELLAALKNAGVTVVSVANNHAMDQGSAGLKRTLDNLESAGLVFIGAGRTKAEAAELKIVASQSMKVAFLAYTYSTNERLPKKAADEPGVNVIGIGSEQDLALAGAQVREARQRADVVAVSLHWGDEYATKPTGWQRRVAAELVAAGADIIIGHHPHVLQPIETVTGSSGRVGLAAFSLGNFISTQGSAVSYRNRDHEKALRGDGIILYVAAIKEGGSTRIDHAEFLPLWTLRETVQGGIVYRPVTLSREIEGRKSKQGRSREEENMLGLLNHRYENIMRTFGSGSVAQ